jgi:hypothetical protein
VAGGKTDHQHAVLAAGVALRHLFGGELRLLRHFIQVEREFGLVTDRQLHLAARVVLRRERHLHRVVDQRQALHDAVDVQVERRRELHVGRGIPERHHAQRGDFSTSH